MTAVATQHWDAKILGALIQNGVNPAVLREAIFSNTTYASWAQEHPEHNGCEPVELPEPMWAIAITDDAYPSHLAQRQLSPPVVIYGIGNKDVLATPSIAVIGTRKMSQLGASITKAAALGVKTCGATLISGLADGCDQAAHVAAIELRAPTIAVIGCGIDKHSNTTLIEAIVAHNGAVISEHPIGTPSTPQRLMARNRIISGLSAGVVVAEAAKDSRGTINAIGCAISEGVSVLVTKPKPAWSNHPGAQLASILANPNGVDPDKFGWVGLANKNCWKHAPLANAVATNREELIEYIGLMLQFAPHGQ